MLWMRESSELDEIKVDGHGRETWLYADLMLALEHA